MVHDTPAMDGNSYEIECLLEDDGEHTIPAEVLEAAPEGFVMAWFTREVRDFAEQGDTQLLLIGRVEVEHRFALGAGCEQPEVMQACERYAEHVRARYAECSTAEPPSMAELCPAYVAESCQTCPEQFDCMAANLVCEAGGLTHYARTCEC